MGKSEIDILAEELKEFILMRWVKITVVFLLIEQPIR
jgi:hypothetical protein